MEKFTILSFEKNGSKMDILLQSSQSFLISIEEEPNLNAKTMKYSYLNIQNNIKISSYLKLDLKFAYEILVHHALSTANIENHTIEIQAFEDLDSLELLKAILLVFNQIKNTYFTMETKDGYITVLENERFVLKTFA